MYMKHTLFLSWQDCHAELRKLSQFLEVEASEEVIANAVGKCEFGRMKQLKVNLFSPEDKENLKSIYRTDFTDIMRKGEILIIHVWLVLL